MTRTALAVGVVLLAAAALGFHLLQRQLSAASYAFTAHPEVLAAVERSLADQKRLAALDPDGGAAYRERFEELQGLAHRLRILAANRESLQRRYERLYLAAFGVMTLALAAAYAVHQSRLTPRLARLETALTALAEGRTDVAVGDAGRDVVGEIATMIERTSRRMARDRERLRTLENLSRWQEAARRHAHEMRTPLTAARLELTRLLDGAGPDAGAETRAAASSALQELDRLAEFSTRFTSFARLPEPRLVPRDLAALAKEFAATYEGAWESLEIEVEAPRPVEAALDRDMVRQVLVNLCDNAARAVASGGGRVLLTAEEGTDAACLEVADDGPGISQEVLPRLFEPYTTTRTVGEGMGLGLAISKKILLDHGGDLVLAATGAGGTTFRLVLPRAPGSGTP